MKFLFLLSNFLLLLYPIMGDSQVIDLGTASSFSVFTSSGAFSNDGPSHIKGDIGTNFGTFSGFPPGTVNGQIHVADTTSAKAAASLSTAYGSLSTMSCGQVLGTNLGGGQTLTPNTYCLGAGSTLNGNLTLNGQGNPNAIFIFKIEGAFSTGIAAKIILTNSTNLANVYWQINGAFYLGTNAVFQGTVLVRGQITLDSNSILVGRALTTNGAIILHTTTVNINQPPLPVISSSRSLTLCFGESVILTSTSAKKYFWSNGDTTRSITVSTAGSYFVSVSDTFGFATSVPTIVTVNPVPSATITANGPVTFCQGGNVILTASGGSSYLWSNGATTTSITVNTSGSYSAIATNGSGCKDTSATTIVTVNPIPLAAVTANDSLSFCPGDSVILTASGGNSYLWSNGATTASITVKASGSFSSIVTNGSGCKDTSATTIVSVNSATVSANGPLTFCQGGNVILTASGGSSYLWSNGATTTSITVNASGNYSVISSIGTGCKDTSATTIVTVNPMPSATISANDTITFCQGGKVILTASGGSSYLWSNGATTTSITVNASGSYSAIATNGSGCKDTATTIVTVNPIPSATISANGPLTFCQGDSVILTASGGNSYLWSNGATTASITVKTSGSFSSITTNGSGCKDTTETRIVSVPSATISANGPVTFCQGDSVILTASGDSSFVWSNGATTKSITVKTSGSYSSIAKNGLGCKDTSAITIVTVNSIPSATITANGALSICQGDSLILTASGGNSYLWSNGATTTSITVKATGGYFIIATNGSGCKDTSATTVVTVNPNQATTITANGPLTFCPGGSVILTASFCSGYIWNTGATTQSILVNTSGSYTVTTTGACYTTSVATVVTVKIPTIIASGPIALCKGDTVKLTSSQANGYLWSTGDTTQTIIVTKSGSYTVAATGSCAGTSSAVVVTVDTLAIPTITANGPFTFCQGDSVILVSSVANKYLWSTGDTSRRIIVNKAGSYSVTTGSCGTVSATVLITVNQLVLPIISANRPLSFCQGDSVVLTSSNATRYFWSTGDTTQRIIVKSGGSYSVSTSGICAAKSITTNVIINPAIVPVITVKDSTTICQGDSITLTSSLGSGFLWSTGDTTQSIKVKTGGSYFVTTAGYCGNKSAVLVITVNSSNKPTITADGPLTFCIADSVLLTSSVASQYKWSNGDTTKSITVKNTGIYTVTTPGICAGVSDVVNVTVNSIKVPLITASGRLNMCIGDSVILTSSVESAYLWNTGDSTRNIIVKQSGTYTVQMPGECGDTSLPIIVNINSLREPTITADGPLTFCSGGSVTLTASPGTYWWSNKATTQSIVVTSSRTYSVRVYNECGYNYSKSVYVNVSPGPDCTIITKSPFCKIESTQLCATGSNAKYLWSTGDTTQCITLNKIGTYSVTATNALGCSSFCSKTITANEYPTCTIALTTAVCPMQNFILSAPIGDNLTYVWNTGATSHKIEMADPGTYTVSITNSNGCVSTCSTKVEPTSNLGCSIMGKTNLCIGESTELKGPMGAVSYLWNTGDKGAWINVDSAGTYTLTVKYADSCVSKCSVNVTIKDCNGGVQGYLGTVSINQLISINEQPEQVFRVPNNMEASMPDIRIFNVQAFPNPFTQSTTIEFSNPSGSDVVKVDVYNVQAQKVASLFEGKLTKNEKRRVRFDATNLIEGIYYYRITNGKQSMTKKLILIKN